MRLNHFRLRHRKDLFFWQNEFMYQRELGDSAESKFEEIPFDSAELQFDLIRFTIAASLGADAIYKLWSALLNVLAKLLAIISLGLAVNAQ